MRPRHWTLKTETFQKTYRDRLETETFKTMTTSLLLWQTCNLQLQALLSISLFSVCAESASLSQHVTSSHIPHNVCEWTLLIWDVVKWNFYLPNTLNVQSTVSKYWVIHTPSHKTCHVVNLCLSHSRQASFLLDVHYKHTSTQATVTTHSNTAAAACSVIYLRVWTIYPWLLHSSVCLWGWAVDCQSNTIHEYYPVPTSNC